MFVNTFFKYPRNSIPGKPMDLKSYLNSNTSCIELNMSPQQLYVGSCVIMDQDFEGKKKSCNLTIQAHKLKGLQN